MKKTYITPMAMLKKATPVQLICLSTEGNADPTSPVLSNDRYDDNSDDYLW